MVRDRTLSSSMQRIIKQQLSQQRRAAAMDKLLELRAGFPVMGNDERNKARIDGRP